MLNLGAERKPALNIYGKQQLHVNIIIIIIVPGGAAGCKNSKTCNHEAGGKEPE